MTWVYKFEYCSACREKDDAERRRPRRVRCAECRSLVHQWCRAPDGRCDTCSGFGLRETRLWCVSNVCAQMIIDRFGRDSVSAAGPVVTIRYREKIVPIMVVAYASENGLCTKLQADEAVKDIR